MGLDSAKYAASAFASGLHERALGVGHSLIARGGMPVTAEEFAAAVVHTVFDALAGGMAMLNADQGWHPDDPRWDRPTPPG